MGDTTIFLHMEIRIVQNRGYFVGHKREDETGDALLFHIVESGKGKGKGKGCRKSVEIFYFITASSSSTRGDV